MRWSEVLSRFNFALEFRPGKLSGRPDALSRREQDMPADAEDERLLGRFKTLLKKARLRTATAAEQTTELPGSDPDALPSTGSPEGQQNATEQGPDVFEDADLQALWNEAVESDQTYGRLKKRPERRSATNRRRIEGEDEPIGMPTGRARPLAIQGPIVDPRK